MLFVLKKIIGTLLLPLSLLLLIMAIGLILLWFSRWQKSAKGILTLSWFTLLLLSLQPVADRLLQPIEAVYPTRQQHDDVPYIVVLGGGYTWQPDWAPSANVAPSSLARITEAIRLQQLNPGAKLIFTGAAFIANRPSTAEVGAYVAESLGVASSDIVTLSSPKDTAEEADAVASYLGQQPFILVTSAAHLPRAMEEFHRAGLAPIAAPANQVAIRGSLTPWSQFLPSSDALTHSERAIYETLGQLWQNIRGLNHNSGPEEPVSRP